jgi:hypothetical protein
MTPERYRLSFTTGGLFLREAPLVVERYLTLGDWYQTRAQVRADNLLQVRTVACATRISKELISRLELLDREELEELLATNPRGRGYVKIRDGIKCHANQDTLRARGWLGPVGPALDPPPHISGRWPRRCCQYRPP